jgi:chromatin segregation and condensation protein Rec8/ScpA/Scc1 (kleisin family)
LTLPQALERLNEFGRKLKRFFFADIPAQDWGERTVLFSAMLEGVRAGELEVEQPEIYGAIEIKHTVP